MAKVRKLLLWCLINDNDELELLTKKERQISGIEPLILALFPGATYCSITGIAPLFVKYFIPVLKKRFPELKSMNVKNIDKKEKVEIQEFLPSDRYEWQDDPEWKRKFNQLLKKEGGQKRKKASRGMKNT